jgi:hypothetical protein
MLKVIIKTLNFLARLSVSILTSGINIPIDPDEVYFNKVGYKN